MDRRRFEHLHVELSLAAGRNLPRYELWLCLREHGLDPEELEAEELEDFEQRHLDAFLAQQAVHLSPRKRRRLQRRLGGFDPTRETPYEWMARISESEG